MTIERQRKILIKIQNLELDIQTLDNVRKEIAASGYASASMSSGGGSKSYTRADISKITELIKAYKEELGTYKDMLAASNGGGTPKTTYIGWY